MLKKGQRVYKMEKDSINPLIGIVKSINLDGTYHIDWYFPRFQTDVNIAGIGIWPVGN